MSYTRKYQRLVDVATGKFVCGRSGKLSDKEKDARLYREALCEVGYIRRNNADIGKLRLETVKLRLFNDKKEKLAENQTLVFGYKSGRKVEDSYYGKHPESYKRKFYKSLSGAKKALKEDIECYGTSEQKTIDRDERGNLLYPSRKVGPFLPVYDMKCIKIVSCVFEVIKTEEV